MITQMTINGIRGIVEDQLGFEEGLNIISGAPNSGKSTFVHCFRVLKANVDGNYRTFMSDEVATNSAIKIYFKSNLVHTNYNVYFSKEKYYAQIQLEQIGNFTVETSAYESAITDPRAARNADYCVEAEELTKQLKSLGIYHFNNFSDSSSIKHYSHSSHKWLGGEGQNTAAMIYLYKNKYPTSYDLICSLLQEYMPTFYDFVLSLDKHDNVYLGYKQNINSSQTLTINCFSDSTLKFFLLLMLLCQPDELLPITLVVDDLDTMISPKFYGTIAELLVKISKKTQVIAVSQHSEFTNHLLDDYKQLKTFAI